jgi:hypothetical protein
LINLLGEAKGIRDFITNEAALCHSHFTSTSNLMFYLDHFGIHHIPCTKMSLAEFKSLKGMSFRFSCFNLLFLGHGVCKVFFSGAHIASDGSNQYLVYHEPNREDSNVNCFHFDVVLSRWMNSHRTAQKFMLATDGASKIRSNLLLALLDYRVRICE